VTDRDIRPDDRPDDRPSDRVDDDALLTAYALGELSPEEAAAVERRLASDPEAARAVDAARAVASALSRSLEPAQGPRLDAERRASVRAAALAAGGSPAPAAVASRASPRPPPTPAGGPMPKLQACPKCAAQFDVSAFAPGQQFTCGACGTLVTAGAPAPAAAGRAPGSRSGPPAAAPAVGKVPGTRGTAGASAVVGHGPQYRPVERHAERGAPAAAKGARRERPSRETEVGGPRKKSAAPLFLGAGALLLVVGAIAFFALGNKKSPDKSGAGDGKTVATGNGGAASGMGPGPASTSPSGTGDAAPGGDTFEAVEADYKRKSEHTSKDLATFLKRYSAIKTDKAKERVQTVAEDLIKFGDPTQKAAIEEAHRALAHMDFHETSKNEIPEEITYYNEPFIRAVQEANAQRWFSDKEQWDIAQRAWARTKAHAERLGTDRIYRALTTEKARISRDDDFKAYNYATYFASPYLIFYSSKDEMDEADLLKMTRAERSKALGEMEEKRKKWTKILAEKGKIYTQLYQYFLKRYGEECELKDLMEPYGGRPDYPPSKRSFAEGVPVVIWIFDNREAFDYHHKKALKDKDASTGLENVAGYFSPKTGWVYLYDEATRQFEIDKNVHEGTHQLEYWFQRQKNEWASEIHTPQSFFGEGFAEYLGSVEMDPQRNLKFIGINRTRLQGLQSIAKDAEANKRKVPVFPVQDLVRFEGYHEAKGYAGEKLGINPEFGLGVFYIQSWALVYFLNEFPLNSPTKKYRTQFNKYLNDILNYEQDQERYGYEAFKKQFNLRAEADWKALDKEFRTFYLEELKKMNPKTVAADPPDRNDWPDFKDPQEGDRSKPESATAGSGQ
jgi:hypothetical protein